MKTRMLRFALLAALVLPLGGCPASAPPITLGLWLFTIVTPGSQAIVVAAELLADGQAVLPSSTPPETNAFFSGTVVWNQSGSTLNLNQNGGNSIYTGTTSGPNGASGTWTNNNNPPDTGLWSAVYLRP